MGSWGNIWPEAFVQSGHEVDGLTLNEPLAPDLDGVVKQLLRCDLISKASVDSLDLSPYQAIVNLAGLANVGKSFDEPELYMRVNVDVLRFIGERALVQKVPLRMIAVSTGAVYDSDQTMPLTEDSIVAKDGSPYAKSKLAMEKEAQRLQRAGLDCIIVRPFNHIGPGQGPGFILPDLYGGLRVAQATKKPLKVGNLKTKRDYTDVRDVVNAYVLLATVPRSLLHDTLYNVCSGVARSGEDILCELQPSVPGFKDIEVTVDPSRIRPNDPAELRGSNERLRRETGWGPSIPFPKTIADFVADQKL